MTVSCYCDHSTYSTRQHSAQIVRASDHRNPSSWAILLFVEEFLLSSPVFVVL